MALDLDPYCGFGFRYLDKNTSIIVICEVICDDKLFKNVVSGPGYDLISVMVLRPSSKPPIWARDLMNFATSSAS